MVQDCEENLVYDCWSKQVERGRSMADVKMCGIALATMLIAAVVVAIVGNYHSLSMMPLLVSFTSATNSSLLQHVVQQHGNVV